MRQSLVFTCPVRIASRWSNPVFSLHPVFYPLVHQMRLVWKIPLVTSWQYPSTSQLLEHFGLEISGLKMLGLHLLSILSVPHATLWTSYELTGAVAMTLWCRYHCYTTSQSDRMSPLLTTQWADFLSTSSTKLSTPRADSSSSSRLTSPQAPAHYKVGLDHHMLN